MEINLRRTSRRSTRKFLNQYRKDKNKNTQNILKDRAIEITTHTHRLPKTIRIIPHIAVHIRNAQHTGLRDTLNSYKQHTNTSQTHTFTGRSEKLTCLYIRT